jgi:hypothetical protein
MLVAYVKMDELAEFSDIKDIAFVTQDCDGLSFNQFKKLVSEGWLSYLIVLPLTNNTSYKVAVTTNYHRDHARFAQDTAIETFIDHYGDDFDYENDLPKLVVYQLIV